MQREKERGRGRERKRESGVVCRIRADGSSKRRNWIPSYIIAFEIAEGVDRDSEREIVQGRKRVHFQRIRARFPRKWIHGNVGGRKHGFRVGFMDFFFLALPFRFFGKKESENVSKESFNWDFDCSCFSLFVIRNIFFFISSFIVLLKSMKCMSNFLKLRNVIFDTF